MKKDSKIIWKEMLIFITFMILAIIIFIKIFYIKYNNKSDKTEVFANVYKSKDIIKAKRGKIYSCDGIEIATTIEGYIIGIDLGIGKNLIRDKKIEKILDSLCYELSLVFQDKTKEQYRQEIHSRYDKLQKYNNYYICSGKRFNNTKDIKSFDEAENLYEILKKFGISHRMLCQEASYREKPCGVLASRTIGGVDNETKTFGVSGLEEKFDSLLLGKSGIANKIKLARNKNDKFLPNIWQIVEDNDYIRPKDGYNVISTINMKIQDYAESMLEEQLHKSEAEFGTVVVMEVKTGKVRAMANLERKRKKNKNNESEYYCEESGNFAVAFAWDDYGQRIDPGSTFKLASFIVALEDGYIKPDDMIQTGKDGKKTFYNRSVLRDSDGHAYGDITVQEVFEKSSNVGTSTIIWDNYKDQRDKFVEGLKKLHLYDSLGTGIKGESKPYISNEMDGLALPWTSVGYQVNITPLQILTLYNAIANNGEMLRPNFMEKVVDTYGNTVKEYEKKKYIIDEKICSDATLEVVKKMLEGVVLRGTAKNISSTYSIAGKTGTAQMHYYMSNKNDTILKYHASFAGYFPADNPQYSCIVSIYKPKKKQYQYGATVAAPVFKKIADKIMSSEYMKYEKDLTKRNAPIAKKGNKIEIETAYKHLNIKMTKAEIDEKWVKTDVETDEIVFNVCSFEEDTKNNKIPDVRGMGLKDALFILENAGLKVKVEGRGAIKEIIPAAGKSYKKGDNIIIKLR